MEKINIVNNVPGLKVVVNGESDGSYVVSISKENQKKLGNIQCGQVAKIGKREFIVLEQCEGRTAVITKDFVAEMKFDGDGDWSVSPIRRYLNTEFRDELIAAVGKDGIIKHWTDGMADDGSGKNLSFEDSVSLLTCNEYRKYREYLPAYGKAWWLATCVTYGVKDYARYVCSVGSSGILYWGDCVCRCGVRPFCFLNSDILVDA